MHGLAIADIEHISFSDLTRDTPSLPSSHTLVRKLYGVMPIKYHGEMERVLTHPHPRTKWQPFRRRYIQMHFREWKAFYFH